MKRILFIMLLCAFAGTAAAQVDFSVGVKAGLNYARMLDEYHGNGQFKPAFHAGLFGNIRFTDKVAFQPELLYSGQGAKREQDADEYEDNLRIVTSYLQVPLMLQYALTEKFTIEAGPQIGVLLNATYKWREYWEDEDEWEPDSNDIKEWYKKTDIGIAAGIGFKVSQRVGLYVRYTQGLTNISDAGEKEINQVIAAGLSLSF